jgi:nucleoside phosphorylase
VLIVTALKDELDALLKVGTSFSADWQTETDSWGLPYYRGKIVNSHGRKFELFAVQSPDMGETVAATTATRLICDLSEKGLRPRCIAMCGICAGRRDAVRLGDVVVADRLFKFDNGKSEVIRAAGKGATEIVEMNVFQDVKTFNLRTTWKRQVEVFARMWSPSVSTPRPRTLDHQRGWLLENLFAQELSGAAPVHEHPDRGAHCPSWTKTVTSLLDQGLVVLGPDLALTDPGRDYVRGLRALYPDGWPHDSDYPSVHIGPIGTNARVQKDAGLFKNLQKILRTILAVEMEGAAVGCVAEEAGIPCLVAKTVVDHADLEKNDSFRMYGCELSAAFVIAFLLESLVLNAEPE